MRQLVAAHRGEVMGRSVTSRAERGGRPAHDGGMALTLWINSTSGERLDDRQLRDLRHRARALYAVNSHIFEDELDALTALGVVSSVSTPEAAQAVQIVDHDRAAGGGDEPAAA